MQGRQEAEGQRWRGRGKRRDQGRQVQKVKRGAWGGR